MTMAAYNNVTDPMPTATATATAEQADSPIMAATMQLEAQLRELDSLLRALDGRLEPVLRPSEPTATNGGQPARNGQALGALAANLTAGCGLVGEMTRRVEVIMVRLQLP